MAKFFNKMVKNRYEIVDKRVITGYSKKHYIIVKSASYEQKMSYI